MPIETRSNSALFRRAEQLRRWEDSETNQVSPTIPKDKKNKIKFSDGCVFLAACAASDTDEVERLLNLGTDINTANVDGLTALHQACIDNNLEMVQFLVERDCDVNRGDNEGWTPLHATASCGFLSIAKYLIENGANVAAVNNDGDLPIDISESNEMEEYLSNVLDALRIDCDAARYEEQRLMLEDVQTLQSAELNDRIHPRTGATPLHVAAAKGYIDVLKHLIHIGTDINAQDFDGWTPLHAAAHWGQKEACAILADNLVNMDIQNFAGQTCFDVAEPELVKLLEELKKKQTHMQKDRPDIQAILQRTSSRPPLKRRTSVTRMSGQEKSKSVMKDTKAERAQIENLSLPEEETEEDKEKIHSKKNSEKVLVEKQSVYECLCALSDVISKEKLKEDGNVQDVYRPKIVPRNETKQVSETTTAKEPELERIPSWKKVLRKANADSMEAEVTLKRPKKTNEDNEENVTQTGDVPIRDGLKSLEQLPSHSLYTTNDPPCEISNASYIPARSPSDYFGSDSSDKRRGTFPQARDDESELQRKAHAKRVRETRRSTQGVLLEDLKSAELQYLINTQNEAAKRQAEEAKDETTVDSPNSRDNVPSEEKSSKDNASLKNSKTNSSNEPKDQRRVRREDIIEMREKLEEAIKRRESSSSNETSPSVTLVLKPKSTSSPEDISPSDSRSSLGTQAAIQRRRRPKRRSTGVVYLDSDDAQEDNSANKENNAQSDSDHTDRARQRYGSASSIPDTASESSCKSAASGRSDTSSRLNASSKLSENDEENDYKQLYELMKEENNLLLEDIKDLEAQVVSAQKVAWMAGTSNSVSEEEKRERRRLERKISELEEEIKQIEKTQG